MLFGVEFSQEFLEVLIPVAVQDVFVSISIRYKIEVTFPRCFSGQSKDSSVVQASAGIFQLLLPQAPREGADRNEHFSCTSLTDKSNEKYNFHQRDTNQQKRRAVSESGFQSERP
jgi:hypothetical protein